MDVFIKRNFWMLPIIVVLVCASLAASAANHMIEATLFLDDGKQEAPRSAKTRPQPKPEPARRVKDADALVTRNMFCSTCEPEKPGAAVAAAPVSGEPQTTSLPLTLVATTMASDGRLATVNNNTTQRGGMYAVGDRIPGAGPVKVVRHLSVDFQNEASGRVERIHLVAQTTVSTAPAPAAPAAARPLVAAAGPEAELMAGVKRVGDHKYELDRAVVDKVLLDPNIASKGVRVMPAIEEGKPAGFRLSFRGSPVIASLGFESGDQIQSINGYELTTPDKTFEAYSKLKSATSLQVAVKRRGEAINLEYAIR